MKNFKQLFEQKEIALYEAYKKEEKRKIRKIKLIFSLITFFVTFLVYFIAILCRGYAWNELYLMLYNEPLTPLLIVIVFSISIAFIFRLDLYPKSKFRDAFTQSIIREAKTFGTTEFLDSMITCLQKHFTLSPTFRSSLVEAMQGYYWYDGEFTGDSYDLGDTLQERLILNINGDKYLLRKWEYTSTHFVFHMENIKQKGIQTFKFSV
jgi:hypothetical protein